MQTRTLFGGAAQNKGPERKFVPRRATSPTRCGPSEKGREGPCASNITYANVVSTLALFVVLGGGAYAVTGRATASGVIHGCVASNGTLRIVGNSHACHKARRHGKHRTPGETPISWNQQGPAGRDALVHPTIRTSEPPHGGVATLTDVAPRLD